MLILLGESSSVAADMVRSVVPAASTTRTRLVSQPRQVEAGVVAFFKRRDLVERQRQKEFIRLKTSAIVMERCEEARREKELVVLYGPPGISKTFSLREYVRQRADQGDAKILLITANAVSTPKALLESLCRLLALPTQKASYPLVPVVGMEAAIGSIFPEWAPSF